MNNITHTYNTQYGGSVNVSKFYYMLYIEIESQSFKTIYGDL